MMLHFARHGESEANLLREFSNRGTKHPLTPRGEDQARDLGRRAADLGISRVYSSPVLRAFQTAHIVAQALGLPSFEVCFDLREYDVGNLEGRSDPESWDRFFSQEARWLDSSHQNEGLEGGETFHDIQTRFRRLVDRVRGEAGDQASVLLVAHGGVLKVGLPAVARDLSYDYTLKHPLANGQIVSIDPQGGWRWW